MCAYGCRAKKIMLIVIFYDLSTSLRDLNQCINKQKLTQKPSKKGYVVFARACNS